MGDVVQWRVHATLARSRANGPGSRFVVWSQGCTLACAGCFNPETHDPEAAGDWVEVDRLVDEVMDEVANGADGRPLEGVTVTGGEPLQQPEAVATFGRRLRERGDLSLILLTGYTRREVEADPARLEAVGPADLVVAGPYRSAERLATGLRGSANKEVWCLTDRYGPADLDAVPEVEVVLGRDGEATVTGMPGPELRRLFAPSGPVTGRPG